MKADRHLERLNTKLWKDRNWEISVIERKKKQNDKLHWNRQTAPIKLGGAHRRSSSWVPGCVFIGSWEPCMLLLTSSHSWLVLPWEFSLRYALSGLPNILQQLQWERGTWRSSPLLRDQCLFPNQPKILLNAFHGSLSTHLVSLQRKVLRNSWVS